VVVNMISMFCASGGAGSGASRDDGSVADTVELGAVLQRVAELVSGPGTDVGWSRFDTAAELQAEIGKYLRLAQTSTLSEPDCRILAILFAPTGALQEVSINSGWAEEFLLLADRVDKALRRS
jgi:hypothetical protein